MHDLQEQTIAISAVVDKTIRDGKTSLKHKDKRRWLKNLKLKHLVAYHSLIKT